MIEKIFIPTVNRVEQQITYSALPESLKRRVVLVVQAWERPQYNYDCKYLILPDTEEYHYSSYYCLPKTRLQIYQAGKNMKYAVLDDDVLFGRRNVKYFGQPSNMEKSKRLATDSDILEMFSVYDEWLNDSNITVCGCSQVQNPPAKKIYSTNASLSSALWINGTHFSSKLNTFDLTSVRVAEDINFLLTLLTNGYGNRVSQEFLVINESVVQSKRMKSTVWDNQLFEQTHNDHKILQNKFPNVFKILYDDAGNRIPGGFRDCGKIQVYWSKAYKATNMKSFDDL